MTQREEIIVRGGFDGTALASGLRTAKSTVSEFAADVGKMIAGMASFSVLEGMMSKANAISNMAAQTGMTIENVQKVDIAFRRMGISVESGNSALEKLNVKVGEARNGSENAQEAFEKWGISIEGKNNQQIIEAISDKMQAMKDPAERAALAVDLMGRSGKELVPLLMQGAEALKSMGEHGSIFSEKDIETIRDMHETMDEGMTYLEVWAGKLVHIIGMAAQGFGYAWEALADGRDKITWKQMLFDSPLKTAYRVSSNLIGSGVDPNSKTEINNVPGIEKKSQQAIKETAKEREKSAKEVDKHLNALLDKKRDQLTLERDISEKARIIALTQATLNGLDEDSLAYHQLKADLIGQQVDLQKDLNQQAENEKEIARKTLEWKKWSNQAARDFMRGQINAATEETEYPTVENLAGRKWYEQFSSQYKKGGRFDLGLGNGPLADIAKEYERAKFQQEYDRTYGNFGTAENDRKRMINARDMLIQSGAASPAMLLSKIGENQDKLHTLWVALVKNGMLQTAINDPQ